MSLTELAALAVSGGGLVAGLLTFLAMRRFALALAAALELWTAAGLLRLSAEGSWRALATAATIVAIRKLVGFAVSRPAKRVVSLGSGRHV